MENAFSKLNSYELYQKNILLPGINIEAFVINNNHILSQTFQNFIENEYYCNFMEIQVIIHSM